jgi:hypothetical protein
VVSINSSGVATTLSEGIVEIRAEIADLYDSEDLQASAAPLESIDIVRTNMPATVGVCTHGYQLTANGNYKDETSPRNITRIVDWSSDQPTIATVSEVGEVATLKGGAVIFTASRQADAGLISEPTNLTIDRDLLTSIAVTPDTDVVVIVGSSQQFTAMGTYSDLSGQLVDITDTVDWLASNTDGVTTGQHLEISTTGFASGADEGLSAVTASCGGDDTVAPPLAAVTSPAIAVTVKAPVILDGITINDNAELIDVDLSDLSVQLKATLVYSDGLNSTDVTEDDDTTWDVVSGTATMLPNQKGKVFFTKTGTSVIKVYYTDSNGKGVSYEVDLRVSL